VTADGLISSNVSGTTLIQAVGTDSNGFADVEIKSIGTVGSSRLYFSDTAGQSGSIKYNHSSDAMLFSTAGTSRLNIDANGDISFYESTGNTPKFFWDASDERLSLTGSDYQFGIQQGANQPWYHRAISNGKYALHLNATGDVMTLDTSGNVGIGTSSPAYQLDTGTLGHNSTGELLLTGGNNASNDYTQTTLLRLRATSINPNRTIHDDAASVAEIRFNHADNAGNDSSGSISFYTNPNNYNTAAAERMRINSSGNLLVGKTETAFETAGVEASAGGGVWSTRSGFPPASFNRLTNDGDIASFYKDGSTVGSIGTSTGDLIIGTGDTGLYFYDGATSVIPWKISTNAASNGYSDLGHSSYQWKDLYLSGGVVFGATGGDVSSKTLDDYEEGTFTPTAFGTSVAGTTTYASQTGSYTKVGDTVHVDIYISWTAMTGTGDLRIGGLPFTSSSASNYYAIGTIVPLQGFTWPSGKTQINPLIDDSATAMSIYGSATDSNSDGAATDNEIVALAITITYKV
jgi:hypothetical protein